MFRAACLLVLISLSSFCIGAESAKLLFDARVGWLSAGTLSLSFEIDNSMYEMLGDIQTSGSIEKFLRWRGRFAVTGSIVDEIPYSNAYLLIADSDRKRTITFATAGTTTIHTSSEGSEALDEPQGTDLMSVLFLSGSCFEERKVHDGEDAYDVALVNRKTTFLRQGTNFVSGQATICDYRFFDDKGGRRKVSIWLVQWNGRVVPARIQVRLPLRPDGILKLRVAK